MFPAFIVWLVIFLVLFLIVLGIYIYLYPIFGTKYTVQVKAIIAISYDHARELGITRMEPEFLLYTIVKEEIGVAFILLKELGFKGEDFIMYVENKIKAKEMPANVNEVLHLGTISEDCLLETI